jgi:hypothetical protein
MQKHPMGRGAPRPHPGEGDGDRASADSAVAAFAVPPRTEALFSVYDGCAAQSRSGEADAGSAGGEAQASPMTPAGAGAPTGS